MSLAEFESNPDTRSLHLTLRIGESVRLADYGNGTLRYASRADVGFSVEFRRHDDSPMPALQRIVKPGDVLWLLDKRAAVQVMGSQATRLKLRFVALERVTIYRIGAQECASTS